MVTSGLLFICVCLLAIFTSLLMLVFCKSLSHNLAAKGRRRVFMPTRMCGWRCVWLWKRRWMTGDKRRRSTFRCCYACLVLEAFWSANKTKKYLLILYFCWLVKFMFITNKLHEIRNTIIIWLYGMPYLSFGIFFNIWCPRRLRGTCKTKA